MTAAANARRMEYMIFIVFCSLFEFAHLMRLNGELKKYGYQLNPTHHMFLPCRNVAIEERCRVKWLYDSEIITT